LTCGHARNAAGAASSIAAKASGQINVLNIHRAPRWSCISRPCSRKPKAGSLSIPTERTLEPPQPAKEGPRLLLPILLTFAVTLIGVTVLAVLVAHVL
jgi:hypothetical protein